MNDGIINNMDDVKNVDSNHLLNILKNLNSKNDHSIPKKKFTNKTNNNIANSKPDNHINLTTQQINNGE